MKAILGVDVSEWIYRTTYHAPLHNNGVDCGIFVMMYIEAIYNGAEPCFDAVCHFLASVIGD